MPRGHSKNIKDKVKDIIVRVKKDNPHFSAKGIIIHLNRKYELYGLKKEEIPQKRSIQKIIAENISNLKDMWASPQEKCWTMGSLDLFPLPMDSLAILLKMQSYHLERMHRPLTRREAKWVSRLYPTILNLNEGTEPSNIIWWLRWWVFEYCTEEQMFQVKYGEKAKDFETFEIDLDLIQSKGEPEKAKNWIWPNSLELPEDAYEENQKYYTTYLKYRMNPCPFENSVKEMTPDEREKIIRGIKEAAQESVGNKSEEA